MGFTNTGQLNVLFLCGGMGFLLGAYYDGFRLLRLLLCPAPAGVFALDCLFCLTAAPVIFLFALAVADGELRAYLFAGMLMGFAAYRRTVGRAVVRTAYRLLRLLHRASRRLRDAVRRAAARLPRPHLPKRLLKKRKKVKKGLATEDEAIV